MPLTAADILAGPILRRVELNLVSAWIAYTAPQKLPVTLKIYRGIGAGSVSQEVEGTNWDEADNPVVRAGAKLFVALAVWQPTEGTLLEPGHFYSYDIEVGGAGLAALGLLQDGTIPSFGQSHEHKALGYEEHQLPSFLAPPASVSDLRILQGSCRSHSGNGHDALPPIDDLIRDNRVDDAKRPHMLWLTGDQIYADEAAPELIDVIADLRGALFDHDRTRSAETLSIRFKDTDAPSDYPVDLEHFPPSRRGNLLNDVAHFTSTSTEAHAMGYGEFVGMYLTAWCSTGWKWDAENVLKGQLAQYQQYLRDTRDLHYRLLGNPNDPSTPAYEVATSNDPEVVKRYLAAMIPFYHAWRMLPAAWRKIDAHLIDDAVEQAWGKGQDGVPGKMFEPWTSFKNAVLGATATLAPRGDIAVNPTPDAKEARLAAALTPSWYAGRHYFANQDLPNDAQELEELLDKFKKPTFQRRIEKLQWGYAQLARVRRLLANVPVYMVFDDHEITDDWNITPKWRKETANPLARGIIRNGLAAFTLCQGWGNDPRNFKTGKVGRKVLNAIEKLYGEASVADPASAAKDEAEELAQLFDLSDTHLSSDQRMAWHFTYEHADFQFIALDTRTWRGYEIDDNPDIRVGFTMDATATLLTDEALALQIPEQPPATLGPDGITFLIAPAPLIGYPVVESVIQPIINLADMVRLDKGDPFERWDKSFQVGRVNRDPENWGFSPALLAAILERLSTRRRVLVLSGDVHYTFTCRLKYWRFERDPDPHHWPVATTTHFIQLTSSSFRAQRDDLAPIVAIDVLQQLGEITSDVRRMGWSRLDDILAPPPVQPGATAFNYHLSRTLSDAPPTAATDAIPKDALFVRRPEWALDTEMLLDNRPNRFDGLDDRGRPEIKTNGELKERLESLGEFHDWHAKNNLPRHWLWWTNFTQIDFSGSPPNRAHHRKYTFDRGGEFKTTDAFVIVDIPLDDATEAETGARIMVPPDRPDFHP